MFDNVYTALHILSESIVMVRADFQGMKSVSLFNMNTVTENYWLIYAAATVIWSYHVGLLFSVTELI